MMITPQKTGSLRDMKNCQNLRRTNTKCKKRNSEGSEKEQKHRGTLAGLQSSLLLKLGQSDLTAHDFIQSSLKTFQGWRLHNLSGQPAALAWPSSWWKSLISGWNISFWFIPITSCPPTRHHGEDPGFVFLVISCKCWKTAIRCHAVWCWTVLQHILISKPGRKVKGELTIRRMHKWKVFSVSRYQ